MKAVGSGRRMTKRRYRFVILVQDATRPFGARFM